MAEGAAGDLGGPHVCYYYKDKSIIDDATSLIVHHMKRQTSECLRQIFYPSHPPD